MYRRLVIALPLLSGCSLLFAPSPGVGRDGGTGDAAGFDAAVASTDAALDAGPGEPTCAAGECQLVVYVTSSLSDAYQRMPSNGQDVTLVNADTMSLPLGPAGTSDANVVGLRFENLRIPQGSAISRAEFEYTAFGDASESTSWGVSMETSVNAPNFEVELTGRTVMQCGATSGATEWEDGSNYLAPVDCQGRLQQLVARPDWDPNNNSVVILSQHFQGENRQAYSYDGAVASENLRLAPRLRVSFPDPGL
mgnify:CR=1 FL=1|tara:strand:- start:26525 stop:27277 length:753 start_codon:yes stop_codon:yes gene_type:complete